MLYRPVVCSCGRAAVPLGLQWWNVPSGLLCSHSSRLSDADLQLGSFNCKQGIKSMAYLVCTAQFLSGSIINKTCELWSDYTRCQKKVDLFAALFCFQVFQAGTNYCNGHTGQQSTLSVLLSWAGSLGVVFVSLQVGCQKLHTSTNIVVDLSLMSLLTEIASNFVL